MAEIQEQFLTEGRALGRVHVPGRTLFQAKFPVPDSKCWGGHQRPWVGGGMLAKELGSHRRERGRGH